jgi:hypothetical protein
MKLLDLLHADAEVLDCVREISHARTILARGSSAHQQVHVYSQARIAGRSRPKALKDVVDFLLATTVDQDDDAAISLSDRSIAVGWVPRMMLSPAIGAFASAS